MEKQQSVETADCAQVRAQFSQFLSGALDANSREQVRAHVLSCRACTLAFGQATKESMTPELTAKFSRSMPRPPQAALTALGIRETRAGTMWANLQTLATESSAWAKAEWEHLQASIQAWLQGLVSIPKLASAERGSNIRARGIRTRGVGGPQGLPQLEIPVVDTAGQSLGRTVRCEIMQPPAVTQAGEFVCRLSTGEPSLVSLRCTVTIGEETKITFTGQWKHAAPQRWMVMVRAFGLPPPMEVVVLPLQSVEFEVVA